jgi:hypothetical protein
MRLIVSAFQLSPISGVLELFHSLFRAAIAFAPDRAGLFPLRFSKSPHAAAALKLYVCGSIADASRLVPIGDLFVFLQKTKDDTAVHLIVTIAKSQEFVPDRIKACFRLAKQILAAGTAPGFGQAIVESVIAVKCSPLRIIQALLPPLAQKCHC